MLHSKLPAACAASLETRRGLVLALILATYNVIGWHVPG